MGLPNIGQTGNRALFQIPPAPFRPHGRKWYVGNSTTALQYQQRSASDSGSNAGLEMVAPFSTIAKAITSVGDRRGDTIYLLPGHAESITSAAGLTAGTTKDGMYIQGLGEGAERATFTWSTNATATWTVAGAGITFDNIDFLANVDELATFFSVTGAHCTFRRCRFRLTDATNGTSVQSIACITAGAAAHYLTVEDCLFWGLGTAAATGGTNAIVTDAGSDALFQRNFFHAAFTTTTGAINNAAAAARMRVLDNTIISLTTSAAKAFVAHASTTGFYDGNMMGVLTGTAPVVAAAMYRGDRNRYAAAANSTMLVLP